MTDRDPRSSMERQRDETEIIRALVLPRHEKTYRNNAEFKAGIDLIARALPVFVQFMAEEAEAQVQRMEQMVREAQVRAEERFRYPH